MFSEISSFDGSFKSPCFRKAKNSDSIECLPYAFIIGFPKCATSDLWERLLLHPEVANRNGKENRFFTQGEFAPNSPEGGQSYYNLCHQNKIKQVLFCQIS